MRVEGRCRKCGRTVYTGPHEDMADAIAAHAKDVHGLGPGASIGLTFSDKGEPTPNGLSGKRLAAAKRGPSINRVFHDCRNPLACSCASRNRAGHNHPLSLGCGSSCPEAEPHYHAGVLPCTKASCIEDKDGPAECPTDETCFAGTCSGCGPSAPKAV